MALDAPSLAADLFCRAGSSVMQRTFDTVQNAKSHIYLLINLSARQACWENN